MGNPTKGMTVRVVPSHEVVDLDGAMPVAAYRLRACHGEDVTYAEDFEVSAVGGTWIPIPAGEWCGLALELGGPLHLEGRTRGGGAFDLELEVGRVEVASARPISAQPGLVLIVGPVGWLSAEALGLVDGGHVEVRPGDALHDALVARIEEGSALVVDDGGEPASDERVADELQPEDEATDDLGEGGASPADGGSENQGRGHARGRDGNPPDLPATANQNAGRNGKPWRGQDTDTGAVEE